MNTSTRSLKTNIEYATASSTEDMLDRLENLKIAKYHYKIENQNDPLRIYFIAEEAQQVAPEILSADGKGVDLYKLATFTLAGVQALADKVALHETRITLARDAPRGARERLGEHGECLATHARLLHPRFGI